MLRASIQGNKGAEIIANGSVVEITVDVAVLIGSLYNQFLAADADVAEGFREALRQTVNNPNSPAWQPIDGPKGIIVPENQ